MKTGEWIKSKKSQANGACVETYLCPVTGEVLVRDSKDHKKVLTFTPVEWDAFVDGAKNGEFDL